MKKSSLKDWFKFQVWRQSGGTLPELCDLSEIREWLNETADDPDLDARISIVEIAADKVQTAASGAPVAPVAANAVLTLINTLSDGDDVTVNDVTYTFKTALSTPTVPNEILIGIDEDASVTNLAAAINGEGTEGIDYSTGTEQPTDVTAVADTGANTVTCTATTAGFVGNSYPKASTGEKLGWDGEEPNFTNGVDGTVGAAGALRFDSSKLYVSVDESTTAVSNWKSVTLT